MQPEHIRMSDHSPSVGEERMVFVQPHPLEEIQVSRSTLGNDERIMMIEAAVMSLQSRVAVLESRTWWSMLKEWISACRLRFIGR